MALVPASSRGATFNGGTITAPLVVDTGAAAFDSPLTATNGGGTFLVALGSGEVSLVTEGQPAQLSLSDDLGDDSVVASSQGGLVVKDGAAVRCLVHPALGFKLAYNAAPDDGDLLAGDMALWFDSTNGAAKLRVKAKQADGTVRTGTVLLV